MGRQRVIYCPSRIESPEHSVIEVFYQNDAVSNIEIKLTEGASRFFKNWLPSKMVVDVPFLVPRICGLCSAAHSICAAQAMENAYGMEVSPRSRVFRELIMGAETVRNHLIHVGLFELPDILAVIDGSWQPQDSQGPAHPVVKDFVKSSTGILNNTQKIAEMLAGGSMPVTNRVGGCFPTNIDKGRLEEVRGIFDKIRIQTRALTESLVNEIYLKNEPSPILTVPEDWGFAALMHEKRFTLASDNLCALNYDLRDLSVEGLKWFKVNPDGEITVQVRKKDLQAREAGSFQGWSEFPLPSIPAIFEQTQKQLGLATQQPLLVGPYARFRLTGENNYHSDRVRDILSKISPEWKQNTLFFALLRLVESLELSQDAIAAIDAGIEIDPEQVQLPRRPVSRQGWAAVEAPRGTLIHHYRVTMGGYVADAEIFVPTDINFTAIRALSRAVVDRLEGSSWANQPKKLLAILNIALRTFDPCISCLAQ